MRNATSRVLALALLSGATGLFVLGHPAEVRAQSLFCPQFIPNLQNGACTNGVNGAFSGAAVASQALSVLSQTTTQATTRNTIDAVTKRRAEEEQRCAEGFSRVDGTCQPIPKPVLAPVAPAPSISKVREPVGRKAKAAAARRLRLAPPAPEVVRREPAPPPVLMPVPIEPAILPVPIEPGVRYATWAQVYGDYEKRNAAGAAGLFETSGAASGAPIGVANVTVNTRTGTVGFLAGADLTSRGVIFGGDGLIAGLMSGYVSSNLTLNATNLQFNAPTQPSPFVGPGLSRTTARVSGPSAGLYATYFNGRFSTDFTLRLDALNLNETFNELSACSCGAPPLPVSGQGSVPLLAATIAGNLNYRYDLYPNFWIEPTVGALYTNSSYGSGAARLGLADGNLVMVQGGTRFGSSTFINDRVLMTTTLTGLAYNDVLVAGGFIPAAAFAAQNLLVQADEGQVRGRGILALNLDYGNGISSFVQGEARGGKGLFGAGGRAGIRIVW